jgi:aspartate aminotransferase-like enzyme
MLLLAPGPVPTEKDLAAISAIEQLPYFRGQDFAETVMEVTEDVKMLFQTVHTPLTVSATGTGLMEMAIVNLLNPDEKVIVINGGCFGKKWVDMCRNFHVNVEELQVPLGCHPDLDRLDDSITDDVCAVLVNAHETSTGYLYDVEKIGAITKAKNALLIVDAVSSIGADEFQMDAWNVDCAMVSTQKALALMPGLGYIVFTDRALEKARKSKQPKCYFDALDYLKNIPRGMTPFTPAMNIIIQMKKRLEKIKAIGIEAVIKQHARLAQRFMTTIKNHGEFGIFPQRSSNSMSSVRLPEYAPMSRMVAIMREKFDWWFAPNPTRSEAYLRVSHMGNLEMKTMDLVAQRIFEVAKSLQKDFNAT